MGSTGEVCRARLSGDLDIDAAQQVRAAVTQLLDQPSEVLELDLRQVSFVDCAGVGLLVGAGNLARHSRRRLQLRITSTGPVSRLLQRLDLEPFATAHVVVDDSSDGVPAQRHG
ncbi:MAG: STAS domain-containing protein [Actinomycetales bacterium]